MIIPEPYRFDAHEGSDCVVRYVLRTTQATSTRRANAIVYGAVQFSVVLRWKEGGQQAYLHRLLAMRMGQRE